MTEEYKYYGDRATGICSNGHFTVAPYGECKHCGQRFFELKILSSSLRLPVKIHGYFVKPAGLASFVFEDGTRFAEDEGSANAGYVIPGVYQALVFSRLFSWQIVTI